jgi:hypothetical protein
VNRKPGLLKEFPWHVLLLTALPVLTLFVAGVSHFHWSELFHPVGIIWTIVVFAIAVLFFWFKSVLKAAVLVSLAGFFLLQFTYIKEIFISPGQDSYFGEIYLLSLAVICVWVLWYYRYKASEPVKLNKILNLFALVLICFQLVKWYQKDNTTDVQNSGLNHFLDQEITAGISPDSIHILYIVLDEYGREDRLKFDFQIDNSEFMGYLKKNFVAADKARSNYWATAYSLSSTLNLEYLDTLQSLYGSGKDNWRILHHCINNARLFNFLRSQNIPIYRTNTTLSEHVQFDQEDEMLQKEEYGKLYNLNYVFWQRSVLSKFQRLWKKSSNQRYTDHARQINDGFESLKQFYANKPGAKSFVYAHFMVPHPPFIFNSEGQILEHDVLYPGNDYNVSDDEWTRLYAEQLAYVNKKVREVIEIALEDTTNPPVIVIQGDHGARRDWGENKDNLDVESLDRFTNLNAICIPYASVSVPEDLTMVNTWRLVLNACFDTDLPMLEDRNFAIDKDQPFLMEDITSTLDSLEQSNP